MFDVARVELLMKQKGINTIKEFEIQCHIANGTISKWRSGAYKPSLEYVERIADFFDVSIDYLVGRSDDPQRK